MRINRFLARCGLGSRRKVEQLILSGQVLVNGKITRNLSTNITNQDQVVIHNQEIKLPKFYYLALNKPSGYTVTKKDPHATKTVFDLVPSIPGLFAVGRLDRDSCGLLLLTNDGNFAQNIIHPSKKIEKEYFVRTERNLSEKETEMLKTGIEINKKIMRTKEAQVLKNGLKIILLEGQKRQIRKMLKRLGHKVTYLQRVRIGIIKLDVTEGKFRSLTKEEINKYATDIH